MSNKPNPMFQKIKNIPLNIPAILLCLSAVFIFSFFTKADSGAKIQFTADTIVSLTGITDGDLYIASNSECDSLSVSGSTLTIGDIPTGSDLILKTSSHNNALKIIPSGGVLDLTFESGHLSSGNITQWTLEGSNPVQAIHIVGTQEANEWYAVKVNGVLLNNYQSNTSNEISFTYDGGFSSKVFTIEGGSAPGGGLPPAAYNPPAQPEPTPENPDGGFSVLINNSDEFTNNQTVTLKLNAGSDTVRMAISNTEDFENASQVLYEEEIEWELSDCHCEGEARGNPVTTRDESNVGIAASLCGASRNDSVCTVYAKFYTQYGVASEVVSDSIILKTSGIETEEQGVADTTIIVDGDIIQCVSSSNPFAVYIVKVVGDTKYIRHIVSLEIFNYYEHLRWENLKQVDSLNNYSLSGWVRCNTGHNNTPCPTDKVYEINDDQSKHWINMTAEDFLSRGGSEPAIFNINQGELNLYIAGSDVMSL